MLRSAFNNRAWADEILSCSSEQPLSEPGSALFLMPELLTMQTASQPPEAPCGKGQGVPYAGEGLITAPTVSRYPSQPLAPVSPPQETGQPALGGPIEPAKLLEELHQTLSTKIMSTAEWLDSFFADPNYIPEINRSYMRVRFDLFQEEYSRPSFKPSFDVRLSLPELERKTHLVFSAEPAASPADKTPVQTVSERFAAPETQRITTALSYIFRTAPKESFLVLSGLQFSGLEPVVFLTPRYRALMQYTTWTVRFTQELQWKSENGWQTDTRFDLERPLPRDCFFRTSLDGVWLANTPGYYYSLSFLVRQSLDAVHALEYEMIDSYQIAPSNKLTEIAFRTRYRQSFWREWLFFELAPQARYPSDHNFRFLPGILLRIEMFFGRPT